MRIQRFLFGIRRRLISSGCSIFALFIFIAYNQLQSQMSLEEEMEVVKTFLMSYHSTCETLTQASSTRTLPLCSCLPKDAWFADEEQFQADKLNYSSLHVDFMRVENGSWKPRDCYARQKVAIIIPSKNRDDHLHHLLNHLHPILQSQLLDYSIFVVDQVSPGVFNKAAVMNAAYLEIKKITRFSLARQMDCLIFHDVDQLPMDNRNMYTCFLSPLHLGGYRAVYRKDRGQYIGHFGGITSLDVQDFEYVNGYSNYYWGWGGEDSNFRLRVTKLNKAISKWPYAVGQTYKLTHKRDQDNPVNYNRRWESDIIYDDDGLSSIKYKLAKTDKKKLYTKMYIDLDPLIGAQMCMVGDNIETAVNCKTWQHIASGNSYCCSSNNQPVCCGKSLFFSYTYTIQVSMQKYPVQWLILSCSIILLILIIRVFRHYLCKTWTKHVVLCCNTFL